MTGTKERSREEQPPPNGTIFLHKPLVPNWVSDLFLGRVPAGIRVPHTTVFFLLPSPFLSSPHLLSRVCVYVCMCKHTCMEGGSGRGGQRTSSGVLPRGSFTFLLLLLLTRSSLWPGIHQVG